MAIQYAILSFIGIVGIVFGISAATNIRRIGMRSRLRGLIATPKPAQASYQTALPRRNDLLPTLGKIMSGWQLTDRLYKQLASAGWAVRPSEYIGMIIGSTILFQVLSAAIFKNAIAFVIFGLIGTGIPIAVLKMQQARRLAAFNAQIIDALEMISSSLRSGFSFLRAMQMVSQEMPAPISNEFKRVVYEVNVGRSLEEALNGVVQRVGSYDFDLVVTAVNIQLQVGGDLANILETISHTLRERIQVMGEMDALTAEGKMSGIILMLLPVGLAIALITLNPKYMAIMVTDPLGPYIIGGGVLLQSLGGLIIKKMLNMDV